MTKRDFFRIIIKLFGLYFLILTLFYWIPSNYVYTIYGFELLPLIGLLVMTALVILLYYAIIKYADNIINITKIDQGFDDEFIIFGDLRYSRIKFQYFCVSKRYQEMSAVKLFKKLDYLVLWNIN